MMDKNQKTTKEHEIKLPKALEWILERFWTIKTKETERLTHFFSFSLPQPTIYVCVFSPFRLCEVLTSTQRSQNATKTQKKGGITKNTEMLHLGKQKTQKKHTETVLKSTNQILDKKNQKIDNFDKTGPSRGNKPSAPRSQHAPKVDTRRQKSLCRFRRRFVENISPQNAKTIEKSSYERTTKKKKRRC